MLATLLPLLPWLLSSRVGLGASLLASVLASSPPPPPSCCHWRCCRCGRLPPTARATAGAPKARAFT